MSQQSSSNKELKPFLKHHLARNASDGQILRKGKTLGKFTIVKSLSQSELNETAVYSVTNKIGECFAAKTVIGNSGDSKLAHELEMITLLNSEVKRLGLVSGWSVKLIDEDMNVDTPYIIMEQYDITLQRWAVGRAKEIPAQSYLLEIQSAIVGTIIPCLEYLESCGIVHGDVKADNFMAKYGSYGLGGWVLIDFDASHKVGASVTTPRCTYFPPEYDLAQKNRSSITMTPHIDWWCLGCMLADMLSSFGFWRSLSEKNHNWISNGIEPSCFHEGTPKDVRDTILKYLLQMNPTRRSLQDFKNSSMFQSRKTGTYTAEFREINKKLQNMDMNVHNTRREVAQVHYKVDLVNNNISTILSGIDTLQQNLKMLAEETVPHHFIIVPPKKKGIFSNEYRIHFGCEAPGHEHFLEEATYTRKVPSKLVSYLIPVAKIALGAALKWTTGSSIEFLHDLFPFVTNIELSDQQIESVMNQFDDWFRSYFDANDVNLGEATRQGIEWIKGIIQEDKKGKLNLNLKTIQGKHCWVCEKHESLANRLTDFQQKSDFPTHSTPFPLSTDHIGRNDVQTTPGAVALKPLPPILLPPNDPIHARLIKAVKSYKLSLAASLIKKGADVNTQDENHSTPVLLACQYQSLDMVTLLTENGAKLNIENKKGEFPIKLGSWAENEKEFPVIKRLLECGADINYGGSCNYTALMAASFEGRVEAVRFLVQAGADVHVKLCEKQPLNVWFPKDMKGSTALHFAQSLEIIQILVRNGADVNQPNDSGYTVLMRRASRNDVPAIRWLVANGADIDHRDHRGWNALCWACGENDATKLLLLLNTKLRSSFSIVDQVKGRLLNTKLRSSFSIVDQVKRRPQCFEAKQHEEALSFDTSFWIEQKWKGLPVNLSFDVNPEKTKSMIEALKKNDVALVEKLIHEGAYVDVRFDDPSHSAIEYATSHCDLRMMEVLLENGAMEISGALATASSIGSLNKAQFLIEKGANINAISGWGISPLMMASAYGGVNMVKFLLDNGADVDLSGGIPPETALMRAAKNGEFEVARLLSDNGANINFQSKKNGRTPLMHSICGDHFNDNEGTDISSERMRLVEFLIQHGCNLELADKDGNTALMFAIKRGHLPSMTNIVKLLLTKGAKLHRTSLFGSGCKELDIAKEAGKEEMVKLIESHWRGKNEK